jgi:hypothetical protein
MIYGYLALPSTHWGLELPEAQIINGLYNLKKFKIPSKQTKKIPISISFPNTLSFNNYKGIIKIKPDPIYLLPEMD